MRFLKTIAPIARLQVPSVDVLHNTAVFEMNIPRAPSQGGNIAVGYEQAMQQW